MLSWYASKNVSTKVIVLHLAWKRLNHIEAHSFCCAEIVQAEIIKHRPCGCAGGSAAYAKGEFAVSDVHSQCVQVFSAGEACTGLIEVGGLRNVLVGNPMKLLCGIVGIEKGHGALLKPCAVSSYTPFGMSVRVW